MGIEPAIRALEQEAAELRGFALAVATRAPELADDVSAALAAFEQASDPEHAAEALTRELRRLWLARAGELAARAWRSPTAAETRSMQDQTRHDAFGYERDLQPEQLERRAEAFFPSPPPGLAARHLVFSSGQAAMASALFALDSLRPREPRPMAVAHLGAYFETRRLLSLSPSLVRQVSDPTRAHVVIVEPVACGGDFRVTDVEAVLRRLAHTSLQAVIIDATLESFSADIAPIVDAAHGAPVIRLHSGLKLLQSGFELANVGLASIHARNPAPLADKLVETRTLTGSGIGLADEIALSAPWFLDPDAARRHEKAVFDHNARLAAAVAEANRRFQPVVHPALAWRPTPAPYCAFRLRGPSPAAYDALEREIGREAEARGLLFEKGGSFGFRGHRYEVVRPETGEPPFLRIAMGARGGPNCDGVIAMMAEIAAKNATSSPSASRAPQGAPSAP